MVMVSLLGCISLSTPDWVVCNHDIPDEYMDLSGATEQDAHQIIFQHVYLTNLTTNAFLFGSHLEYSSNTSFPLYLAEIPLRSEHLCKVILRI